MLRTSVSHSSREGWVGTEGGSPLGRDWALVSAWRLATQDASFQASSSVRPGVA